MSGVIRLAELAADHDRNALERPDLGRPAVSRGPLEQRSRKCDTLLVGQSTRSTTRPRIQRRCAACLKGARPAHGRLPTDTAATSDVGLGEPGREELARSLPSIGRCLLRHPLDHTDSIGASPRLLSLYYANISSERVGTGLGVKHVDVLETIRVAWEQVC